MTRTTSEGGVKTLSAMAMEWTLCHVCRVSVHFRHPSSRCSCIVIFVSGASRFLAKSAHAASLKCFTRTSAGGADQKLPMDTPAFLILWFLWNKGGEATKKYRVEEINS